MSRFSLPTAALLFLVTIPCEVLGIRIVNNMGPNVVVSAICTGPDGRRLRSLMDGQDWSFQFKEHPLGPESWRCFVRASNGKSKTWVVDNSKAYSLRGDGIYEFHSW